MSTAAELIDHALVREKLTVRQAAEKADVGQNTLRRIRAGESVSPPLVGKVADALNIDGVELWMALNATDRSAA